MERPRSIEEMIQADPHLFEVFENHSKWIDSLQDPPKAESLNLEKLDKELYPKIPKIEYHEFPVEVGSFGVVRKFDVKSEGVRFRVGNDPQDYDAMEISFPFSEDLKFELDEVIELATKTIPFLLFPDSELPSEDDFLNYTTVSAHNAYTNESAGWFDMGIEEEREIMEDIYKNNHLESMLARVSLPNYEFSFIIENNNNVKRRDRFIMYFPDHYNLTSDFINWALDHHVIGSKQNLSHDIDLRFADALNSIMDVFGGDRNGVVEVFDESDELNDFDSSNE